MKQKLEVLEGCHNSALGGGHFNLGGIRRLKKFLNDSIGLALLMTLENFVAPVTNAKELTGTLQIPNHNYAMGPL